MCSENAHHSDDIDLIPEGIGRRERIRSVMLALVFPEYNRYFSHPETFMLVEFPAGPPAVGEERPRDILIRETAMGSMRLLSPTDCVEDRLTWWFYNGDRHCLEQAAAVAAAAYVDLKELRRWSKGEGKVQEFARVAKSFKARRQHIGKRDWLDRGERIVRTSHAISTGMTARVVSGNLSSQARTMGRHAPAARTDAAT